MKTSAVGFLVLGVVILYMVATNKLTRVIRVILE